MYASRQLNQQSWTKLVETQENYQPFSLGVNSPPSPLVKGSFPFPLFQYWKQINIQEAFCNIVWGGGGEGRGVTTDEKGVFIQIQNTFVSLKTLVLVNCLNTFVHD